MTQKTIHFWGIFPACVALPLAFVAWSASAQAQIKRPGVHPLYVLELEPHLLVQHADNWRGENEGFGPGVRASIPILENGPVPSINNSLAIGFGIDWAIFGSCDGLVNNGDCDVNQIWLPFVGQWNFFFTPVVSVFGEAGLAIVHRKWSYGQNCSSIDDDVCSENDLSLFNPVFYAGGRFLFSKNIGLVVRLGFPAVSVGATFLM